MKSRLLLLLLGLAFSAHVAAGETMTERELKRIVQRERAVLATAKPAGDRIEDSGFQTQLIEVARDYDALLKRDPEFVPTYVAYGLFLSKGGEAKRATELFRKADQLDPNVAVVKNQLGNSFAEEGMFAEALAQYEAAAKLEPKEPLYRYQAGLLLYEYREQFAKAGPMSRDLVLIRSNEAFAKAAELAPDNFAYAYRHAESFADLLPPDWHASLAAWQALEPRTKPGVELQTVQLQEANALIHLEHPAEARKLLELVTEPALQNNKKTLVAQLTQTPNKAP